MIDVEKSGAHDTFMNFLRNPDVLIERIENFLEEERGVYSESINGIVGLKNYIFKNWRSLVAPTFALSLGLIMSEIEKAGKTKKNQIKITDEDLFS